MRQTDLRRNIQFRDSGLHVLFFLEQNPHYCYNIDKQIKNVETNECHEEDYVEAAEFDCLHDEGILYAQKLKEAGAYVEVYDTKGTYHGYDAAIDAQIVQDQIAKRVAFLKRGFSHEVRF